MAEYQPQISNNSLPPQSIDLEEAILGGILLDPNAIGRIIDIIKPEAFYLKAHQQIYEAAFKLHTQGKPTDLITITAWLSDQGLLEKIGGPTKLAQLVDRTISAVNIDNHAKTVMDKYMRRQLITAGGEISQLGFDTTKELENILDESEQKIFQLTQKRPQQGLVSISESLVKTYNEIESLHDNIALPGITSDFYDLDAMTSGFQRSDLIIVAARPSMGKCCAASSEIVLANGSLATIEDVYYRRQVEILTLEDNWLLAWTKPSDFVDDGIKPVFRVTTRLGRFIETTLSHPYLTVQGWRKLEELQPGIKIAVPRKLDVFGQETLSESKVKLLAYLIGDGCLRNTSPTLTDSNPLIQQDFSEAVAAEIGLKVARKTATINRTPLKNTGEELGIWGKDAHQKTIPEIVFRLERSLLALFLNRLFATGDQLQLKYATVSEKLARQIQHLLLRFGVIARLKKIDNHPLFSVWQLDITESKSIQTFIDEIDIFCKEQVIFSEQKEKEKDFGDVYWDEIVAIEYVGNKQVYDLTIPKTHNFIANDICVHNTSFALNIAHNIATKHKLPIAIFSLEMSKEQLALRLLASESGIPSNRLRSGRLSQTDFDPLNHAVGVLSELPIYIDDTANLTVIQMRSEVRRLQAEKGTELGLVLLDYLQLMEGGGENRVQELSRITRSLKGLSREANVPVIALSQLSRAVEQRTNKRPMLSDLRESGSIEQDADLVMMLYRDEYYSPDTVDRGIAEIHIAKHRNGPTGIVKLLFNPELTKFLNMQRGTY